VQFKNEMMHFGVYNW